ncbi:PulJ/GspJ family protein [Cellulomonas fimi]|uniref:Prepilin-type cleavage/methylation-like protein n=1 Tax=Cellulomonas fimi (strain ATCC 484 / DSM 20113 / JCM 1341 / CCUG 24087 / LMG 16345 / NBRC 15513 / NCIMB 8980 / NCTC 7547 / NRS-133) TaxID=590998 RepID=F4H085_CELFA|nr:hypothetical protein [Cellulomonas fimi]AEE46132.1 hypothetical protein Celf_2002 [Cellulomonas fimi ATCC 484]VEH31759.1 Tfp pilus assembly protein PilW [Cellulomonas fimi]
MTRRRDDDGSSLPELLVSMLILSFIIAATATLTIGFQRTTAQNVARQDQVDTTRAAVERMSKTVRTAVKPNKLSACVTTTCDVDAFVSAGAFAMQFYANLDNSAGSRGPSRVTYQVATSGADKGVLVEKVQRPDTATPVAGSGFTYCDAEAPSAAADCKKRLTVRRLATGVQTTGTPLFQYFRSDGTTMTVPAGGLTAADISEVLSVELTVKVRSASRTNPGPTTAIQRVLLPNSLAVLRPDKDTP